MRDTPSIAIIGTGFGGIGMGIRLKQAGIDSFAIYGKSCEVGGVWWDNTYPGAACDVASSLYSFSFEKNFDWSRTHGTQREIVAYLRHCVEKYGLRPHMHFSTEIAALHWDEGPGLWRLDAADGRRFEARAVVSACGLFNQPAFPDLPGLDTFRGAKFHSSQWDHDYDLGGKRVAVIGTGCSAAQFVPEIVGKVGRLAMFLRTPQYIMPKIEKNFSDAERQAYRRFPLKRTWERLNTYVSFERRFGVQTSAKMNAAAEQTALAFLAREITDPDKRAKLTPDYRFGCKRTIQSNAYYKALNRDNVEIVRAEIERVLPDGILTADGQHHALDAIIYGTGFRPSDYLSFMRVTGRDGRAAPRRVARGAGGLSRHHSQRLPQFLHALRPQYQHRDLDHLHDREPDRLCPEMHPPPAPASVSWTCAATCRRASTASFSASSAAPPGAAAARITSATPPAAS